MQHRDQGRKPGHEVGPLQLAKQIHHIQLFVPAVNKPMQDVGRTREKLVNHELDVIIILTFSGKSSLVESQWKVS